jgi:DNA polymerase-4
MAKPSTTPINQKGQGKRMRERLRRILHVDMDAFYASVEQADNPELRGKPVIIGGGKRGVVSAASYEARNFGVHSAMPIFQARRLCPNGIFLPVRMKRYREVSHLVMAILGSFTPLLEKASVDEAYLDVTGTERLFGPAVHIAEDIKRRVRKETGLTCSIGIAPNKFLAKIASDMDKPDGLTVISHESVQDFLKSLPVQKIPGVGKRTLEVLKKLGVVNVSDILRIPEDFLTRKLGKAGMELIERARGIDNSPVVPFSEPKSFSAEHTLPEDTGNIEEIRKHLLVQSERVGHDLRIHGYTGRTIRLKLKFADFRTITRSRTFQDATSSTTEIYKRAVDLLDHVDIRLKVRLIGVGVSTLTRGARQLSMLDQGEKVKERALDSAVDMLRQRYGSTILVRGSVVDLVGKSKDDKNQDQ